MRILVFGDSIVYGMWDVEGGGWVARIKRHYDELQLRDLGAAIPEVYNLGVSGGTAAPHIAERIGSEILYRSRQQQVVAVVAVGLNDSMWDHGLRVGYEARIFPKDLQDIVNAIREYTDKILFVGLTACDESKTKPVSWGDYVFTNESILEYENMLSDFCTQQNIPLVRLFNHFRDKPELLVDGLHPNETGHELISNLVKSELEKLLG
ncbi:MAG TPA: GDSL-type esterase/lipase family protein [Verrucomicrobiae bacterium]|nr:GDSL-type esterase/lipase family protein [Verrucomicrobiae bacterium]